MPLLGPHQGAQESIFLGAGEPLLSEASPCFGPGSAGTRSSEEDSLSARRALFQDNCPTEGLARSARGVGRQRLVSLRGSPEATAEDQRASPVTTGASDAARAKI